MVSSTQRYIDRRKSAPGFTPTQTSSAARKVAGTALSLSPQIYKLLTTYAKQQGISVGELIKTTYGDVKDSVLNIIDADGTSRPVDIAKDAFKGLKDKFTGKPAERAVDQMWTNSPAFDVDPSKLYSDTGTGLNPANLNNFDVDPSKLFSDTGMGQNPANLNYTPGNTAGGTGQLYSMGGGPGGGFGALQSNAGMGGGFGAVPQGHPGMGMAPGYAPQQGFLGNLGAGINAAAPAGILGIAAMTALKALGRPRPQEAFNATLAQNQATGYGGSPWSYSGNARPMNVGNPDGTMRAFQPAKNEGFNTNRTGWEDSMIGPSATNLADWTTLRGGRAASAEAATPFEVYNEGDKDYVKVGPNNPLYKRMGLTNPTGGGVSLNRYGREQMAYRNEMQDKAGENRGK